MGSQMGLKKVEVDGGKNLAGEEVRVWR